LENEKIKPIFGDLQIRNGKIIDVIKKNYNDFHADNQEKKSDQNSLNAAGKVVTLPLINFHDHFYSRLAKGLAIKGPMDNFENILKNLWWKLDIKLDAEMVKASVQMAAMESIQNGVTYIFDHNASPKYINGSLALIAETLQEFGLRSVLCSETSDRNGERITNASLKENEQFLLNNTNDDFKAMLGLHASFTISDETLEKAGQLINKYDWGIHIHLGEGQTDRRESQRLYGNLPTRRLKKYGLLNPKSILAHGVDLIDEDYLMIKEGGSALVYNPDSNLNNAVGLPNYKSVPDEVPVLAGTDGMHANVAKSLKQLFLLHRLQGNSFEKSLLQLQKTYFDQIKFVRQYFPDFPLLQIEDRADFIVWDYIPPTPFTSENFWGHYIYGILESPVQSIIHNGKFLMKNHKQIYGKNIDYILLQGKQLFKKFK
jgi:cytosine/adenosine deaminase-related metal-dependent hydrolase